MVSLDFIEERLEIVNSRELKDSLKDYDSKGRVYAAPPANLHKGISPNILILLNNS